MDENIASYRLECLTNICRSNKNLKSYKISGFAYRDPKFFNLGTYCPLLESLTLINNYRAFSSHPTEEEIEDFTKGCRNLKYLHIESWIAGDIMEDILQCLGSNNPLLEALHMTVDPNGRMVKDSSFTCLFYRCSLLKDIKLT